MSSLADLTLARIRALHDDLVDRATTATDEQLAATSGASEWPVAQVLSHLGSQGEIALAGLPSFLEGGDAPGPEFNEAVWARWNSLDDRSKANGFVEHSSAIVAALEAVPGRDERTVTLGFLPTPLPFAAAMGMRLNEYALHHWDVVQGLDGDARIDEESAALMAQHLAGGMSFMLGFIGKADQLVEPVVLKAGDLVLTIDDAVGVTPDATPTATLDAPLEAGIRLVNGRLREDVAVEGNVTLAELRKVFPGY
ncbi:MAG: hypothetical protein JWL79_2974 [Frankiales bacterium]|nr:hypothetical protein [Frankiales bacterium]